MMIKGSIPYEISEEEIKKEVEDYKRSLPGKPPSDERIRDLVIKSLIKYKVGLESYSNPEIK